MSNPSEEQGPEEAMRREIESQVRADYENQGRRARRIFFAGQIATLAAAGACIFHLLDLRRRDLVECNELATSLIKKVKARDAALPVILSDLDRLEARDRQRDIDYQNLFKKCDTTIADKEALGECDKNLARAQQAHIACEQEKKRDELKNCLGELASCQEEKATCESGNAQPMSVMQAAKLLISNAHRE